MNFYNYRNKIFKIFKNNSESVFRSSNLPYYAIKSHIWSNSPSHTDHNLKQKKLQFLLLQGRIRQRIDSQTRQAQKQGQPEAPHISQSPQSIKTTSAKEQKAHLTPCHANFTRNKTKTTWHKTKLVTISNVYLFHVTRCCCCWYLSVSNM